MSHIAALRGAKNIEGVAKLVGFRAASLAYVLYGGSPDSNYVKFEIPKRYGGTRQISAPAPPLKLIQRRLADLLQNCVEEINAANGFSDAVAHGFKRNRSIVTNAQRHRRRRYVFNIDLEDFFPSINFGRVRGFFLKDKHFALEQKVATILAQIACYENGLPQGSPCSPVISNLIGNVLDVHLVRLAAKCGCTYTRYADDLSFSTNQPNFPSRIACRAPAATHTWIPGAELTEIIQSSGFAINQLKTRMQYQNSRQEVTGLIVNRKLNVPREYRHEVRAMVHRLINVGSFEFVRSVRDGNGNTTAVGEPGTVDQLHGMLGFIDEVDKYNREIAKRSGQARREQSLSSKETMYRRFLLFTYLYAAPRPVLICEGATDNIYLLHAIRALATDFPKLATVAEDGTIALNIRLLKYAESGTGRILGITSGGSANLSNLIWTYHREKDRFKAPGLTQPVILLVDNDAGAKPVFDAIAQITKSKPTQKEAFLHVTGNFYVVPTPYNDVTKFSRIEDCFDAKVKATVVDGKTFDPSKRINTAAQYGKTVFAHKVVRQLAPTIDFVGFTPVLERLVSVLEVHAQKLATAQAMEGLQPV